MEGCVKFNPFYVREIREKSSGLLRFESGPDNSKTMSVDMGAGHGDRGGQALCGVVLDAVFHAGQVIPLSAEIKHRAKTKLLEISWSWFAH
jgi:hypothetical protein